VKREEASRAKGRAAARTADARGAVQLNECARKGDPAAPQTPARFGGLSPHWELENAVAEAIGLIDLLSERCQQLLNEQGRVSEPGVAAGLSYLASSTSNRLWAAFYADKNSA
jgi:hypothetical protein